MLCFEMEAGYIYTYNIYTYIYNIYTYMYIYVLTCNTFRAIVGLCSHFYQWVVVFIYKN